MNGENSPAFALAVHNLHRSSVTVDVVRVQAIDVTDPTECGNNMSSSGLITVLSGG